MIDILLLDAIDVQHVVLRMAPGSTVMTLAPQLPWGGEKIAKDELSLGRTSTITIGPPFVLGVVGERGEINHVGCDLISSPRCNAP